MRTGAEYRAALRDGRRVWVLGEGLVEDVTTHPATRAMVDEYVAWYDLHFDPEWVDVLLSPLDTRGERRPWAYVVPLSAGNITHTPAYGDLIAIGVVTAVQDCNASPQQIANALVYREHVATTGRI